MKPTLAVRRNPFFGRLLHNVHLLIGLMMTVPFHSFAFLDNLPIAAEATAGNAVVADLNYSTGYGVRADVEFAKNFCADLSLAYLSSETVFPSAGLDVCPKFAWWQPRVGGRVSYLNAQRNLDSWFSDLATEAIETPIWIGFSYQPLRFQFGQFRISLFEISSYFNFLSESAWRMQATNTISVGWQYTSL